MHPGPNISLREKMLILLVGPVGLEPTTNTL